MRFTAGWLLALLLVIPLAQAKTDAEATREVEYLIDFVATSGCQFIRNGSAHEPEDAADHLRLKFRRGQKYVDTAEHFIDRLASESSWTGRNYTVDCDSGTFDTGPWLHQALKDYRSRQLEVIPPTPAQGS